MFRLIALSVASALSLSVASTALADESAAGAPQPIAGLREPARVTVDNEGISHVRAHNDHDLYFMQGWVHAGDRLFQMDYNRRLASGTVAELLGVGPQNQAITTDVQ